MELQEFIESSLLQICNGIRNAQRTYEVERDNCPIAPTTIAGEPTGDDASVIFFDLGITISNGKSLDVSAGAFGLGAKGELNGDKEEVNKIQFSVPFYPTCLQDRKYLSRKEKT